MVNHTSQSYYFSQELSREKYVNPIGYIDVKENLMRMRLRYIAQEETKKPQLCTSNLTNGHQSK